MIIPSDDDLDAGAVVVRDDESGQGKVDFGTATGGVVSLWWDEDARSSEIVWREGGGDERARIEWSDVEQVRLTALKDGVQVALVIPATSPAAALTVRVVHPAYVSGAPCRRQVRSMNERISIEWGRRFRGTSRRGTRSSERLRP